jgi:hypothetical protein
MLIAMFRTAFRKKISKRYRSSIWDKRQGVLGPIHFSVDLQLDLF